MDEASILTHVRIALTLFLTFTLPPLLAALVVGLVVGIVQAATQIQDQTLPQTVKLLTVVAVLAVFFPLLASPLIEHTKQLFTEFSTRTLRR
ncbi:MAG: flagellar biosynthetic protein FliQ [Hyphomicrobiaceae bacterium]|nr:flagellar biosynthetic protein FliQ [Hyphomicrobiaceae bacterium]